LFSPSQTALEGAGADGTAIVKVKAQVQESRDMLKNYPKEIILKDGSGVTLRPLQGGDEKLLRKMYERMSEEDRWFLESDVSDFETIRQWTENNDLKTHFSIVAVLEGEIIAHATLIRKDRGASSHIGKIRISVAPAFRERHLGTWMLLELNNLAISIGLEILLMHLVGGRDTHVSKGVQRLDFREEAVLQDCLKDREGNPYSLVIMVKRLKGAWEDTEEFLHKAHES
jgi:hypothetical protein